MADFVITVRDEAGEALLKRKPSCGAGAPTAARNRVLHLHPRRAPAGAISGSSSASTPVSFRLFGPCTSMRGCLEVAEDRGTSSRMKLG